MAEAQPTEVKSGFAEMLVPRPGQKSCCLHNIYVMTKLLDEAVTAVRRLPPELQDEIARAMLAAAGDGDEVHTLPPEEEEDIAGSEAEVVRGEFATDEEVRAVWAKFGF